MKSWKKAGFMLLMVMLFVFLTACGSEKKEEPEIIVITTEQTEEAMEETTEEATEEATKETTEEITEEATEEETEEMTEEATEEEPQETTGEWKLGILEIQSVEGWTMEKEFPDTLKSYDVASEALKHASDNKLLTGEEEGSVNISYFMADEYSIKKIRPGHIIKYDKEIGDFIFPKTTGDIQSVSIKMKRELEEGYEVVYEVVFENDSWQQYSKYIAFQIE